MLFSQEGENMTYNEFMNLFNDFVKFKIKIQIEKYGSAHEAAVATGVPESSISKYLNNKQKQLSKKHLTKFLEEDIYTMEIKDIKELEIEYLEKRLEQLKKRNHENIALEKDIKIVKILCIIAFGMTAVMIFSPGFPPRSGT